MAAQPDAERQAWLAVLARAPAQALMRLGDAVLAGHAFERLREPEVGLVMLRGRIGNTGDRFNVGEATLARCVVRHRGAEGQATVGVGYVLGRDGERARRIAQLDALLQQPARHAVVMHEVLEPLRELIEAAHAQSRARAAASRVHFVELQPELEP